MLSIIAKVDGSHPTTYRAIKTVYESLVEKSRTMRINCRGHISGSENKLEAKWRRGEGRRVALGADILRTWRAATRRFKRLVSKTCSALWLAGFFRGIISIAKLFPWEKLAMLEAVVSRGRLNSPNKVDYTLSTACWDARSIGFSAYLLAWPTSSRPRRMTINTKHTIINYCRMNKFFYWVNNFTRKLNIFFSRKKTL